jgi:hypothetical protein
VGCPALYCVQEELFGPGDGLAALAWVPPPKHKRRVHMFDDLLNGTMSVLLWVFQQLAELAVA